MTDQVKGMLCKAYLDHTARAKKLHFYTKSFVMATSIFLALGVSTAHTRDLHLLILYFMLALVSTVFYAITVYRREKELDRLVEINIEKIRNKEVIS